MTRRFNSIALALTASLQSFGSAPTPEEFLRPQLQLSPVQVTGIRNGNAFAKILPSSNSSDIFVVGAVYIHAKPAAYLQFMRDVTRRKMVTGNLGAGEFSAPPAVGDLDGLSSSVMTLKILRTAGRATANCSCRRNPWKPRAPRSDGIRPTSPNR